MLSQADEAKTLTNKAGTKEKVQVEVLGSYGTDGNIDKDLLNENLKNVPNLKYKDNILSEDNKIERLPADVEVDGDIYEIKADGNIISVENSIVPGKIITEEQGNTTYTKNGTAVIPVGFSIVPGLDNVSEGLVISDVANDVNDTGNQFVWIPVEKADDYKTNTTYANINASKNTIPDEKYLPTEVEIPDGKTEQEVETDLVTKDIVEKYGVKGFYISRYEAGDGSATAEKEKRTEESDTTGKLVSKKGAYVYNWISQIDAKRKAQEFKNDANVKSGLCTGIQWDMAMAFVNGKKDGNGNDYNVIQGLDDETTFDRHTGSLSTSGQNPADKVCNIYDLEGNCFELVAEKNNYPNDNLPYINRGGTYNDSYQASSRHLSSGNPMDKRSFRFVLYIM